MGIVTGSKRNLGNVHRAHPQFSPGAFHAHTPDIASNVVACMGCEDAMKVGHREAGDCCQHFPIERFVDVLADVYTQRLSGNVPPLRLRGGHPERSVAKSKDARRSAQGAADMFCVHTADVSLDRIDTFAIVLRALYIIYHT